jgi:glutathione S-transferase
LPSIWRRGFDYLTRRVRDLRVRRALDEVGLPYRTTLVGDGAMPRSAYRKIQPFGQIPAIEDGNLVLFESGAIVLDIAERFPGLLPDDAAGRAHATQWMFAALNTIEGRVQQFAEIDLFHADPRLVMRPYASRSPE